MTKALKRKSLGSKRPKSSFPSHTLSLLSTPFWNRNMLVCSAPLHKYQKTHMQASPNHTCLKGGASGRVSAGCLQTLLQQHMDPKEPGIWGQTDKTPVCCPLNFMGCTAFWRQVSLWQCQKITPEAVILSCGSISRSQRILKFSEQNLNSLVHGGPNSKTVQIVVN